MDADRDLRSDAADEVADHHAEVVREGVPDGVGDVDGGGTGGDDLVDDAPQEVELRARRVLRRELHVVGVLQRPLHALDGLRDDLVLAGVFQHHVAVDLRGGEEDVDPAAGGAPQPRRGPLDVIGVAARQRGDHRRVLLRADGVGDGLHRLVVALGRDREPGLDHVDVEAGELLGDLQLLLHIEGDAGCLFAVAQRCVEHGDALVRGDRGPGGYLLVLGGGHAGGPLKP